jgi:hypothetical protein
VKKALEKENHKYKAFKAHTVLLKLKKNLSIRTPSAFTYTEISGVL